MIRFALAALIVACGLAVGDAAENLVSGAVEARTAIIEEIAR